MRTITWLLKSVLPLVWIALVTDHIGTAQIRVLAVTDGATFTPGLPYYGSLATVFCTGLNGLNGIQGAPQYPLPYSIAGVTVYVSGAPAPLLAVADLGGYQQVNFQVPAYDGSGPVEVQQSGQTGQLAWWAQNSWGTPSGLWGVFFTGLSGYAIAQHADFSPVTHDHPAQPGEAVVVYGTNLDVLSDVVDAPPIGSPATADPLPSLLQSSSSGAGRFLTLNGTQVDLLYAGLAPGLVGVFQVNFRVPSGTPDGDATLNAVLPGYWVGLGFAFGYYVPDKASVPAKLPVRAT
jgi:uncharacterized protein (TIGR03437 family)